MVLNSAACKICLGDLFPDQAQYRWNRELCISVLEYLIIMIKCDHHIILYFILYSAVIKELRICGESKCNRNNSKSS